MTLRTTALPFAVVHEVLFASVAFDEGARPVVFVPGRRQRETEDSRAAACRCASARRRDSSDAARRTVAMATSNTWLRWFSNWRDVDLIRASAEGNVCGKTFAVARCSEKPSRLQRLSGINEFKAEGQRK